MPHRARTLDEQAGSQAGLLLTRSSLALDRLRNVPLHAAAFSDNVSIARCLLTAKAEVDPPRSGWRVRESARNALCSSTAI